MNQAAHGEGSPLDVPSPVPITPPGSLDQFDLVRGWSWFKLGGKMPPVDTFNAYVLEQLDGLDCLACRPMFGGHGLYSGEQFFGILFEGRLYFRTDPVTRSDYESRGMRPFQPNPGQVLKSYWEVPVEIVEHRADLLHWARRALASGTPGDRGR